MLSLKAKAAVDKIKSLDEDDAHTLSEVIRHEVEHLTESLARRTRHAEDRLKHLTDVASSRVASAGHRAQRAFDDHPVSSSLVALGLGFMLGALLLRQEQPDA